MKWLPVALSLLYPLTICAADIEQRTTTTGWCSPAVVDTRGDVTIKIECHGVDPRALERLNELLDKKDLELQEKLREAEEWARKYRELEQRLAAESTENELARQAETLLKAGKLEEAGAILDQLLESGEHEIDRIASYQYSRAQVYALEFKPLKALPHYAKAFQYRPENPEYAFTYARVLQEQHAYSKSEPIYRKVLTHYRQLTKGNASIYLPYVAKTLNNLAVLYSNTQRLESAERAYQEALEIRRQLARDNPPAYRQALAKTLILLARLYSETERPKKAHQTLQEAIALFGGVDALVKALKK